MAAENELFIYLRMVDQASAQAKRAGATMRDEIQKTTKEQQASDDAYVRAMKKRADAINAWAKEVERRRKERTAQEAKDDDEYVKAQRKNANAIAKIEKDKASDRKNLEREVNQLLKGLQDDETRAAKKALAEQARAKKEANRQQIQDIRNQYAVEKINWKWKQDSLREQAKAQDAVTSAVMGYIGAFAGFGTVLSAVKSLADYYDQIRRDTNEATEKMIHYREILLELAALKGTMGNTTPALQENMALRAETGQSADAAAKMLLAAEGSGQAAKSKFAPGEWEKYMKGIGKFQMLEGSNPEAYGDLAGVYALEAKQGDTADDLLGRVYKAYMTSQPGRFQGYSQFGRQRAKASMYQQNGLATDTEINSLITGFSMGDPGSAGERLDQAMRAVSAGMLRARKMKVAPGTEYMDSSQYFKKLGINDQVSPYERIMRIADDINAYKEQQAKVGKQADVKSYLLKHGIVNNEDAETLMMMSGLKEGGAKSTWEAGILPAAMAKEDPGAIDRQFQFEAGRSPLIQKGLSKVSEDAAMLKRGQGNAEADLAPVRREAFSRVFARGQASGTFEAWQNRPWYERLSGSVTGYDERINMEAQSLLAEQAKKVGINWEAPRVYNGQGGGYRETYAGDTELHRLQQQIQQSGGNPLGGVVDEVKKTNQYMKSVDEKLGRIALPPPPPPQPGNPAARGRM